MVPMSFLVGYIPTKKFKKDVRDYCQSQYETMLAKNTEQYNNGKKLTQQKKQPLPKSTLIGSLIREKRVHKPNIKKKDYYKEDVITFDDNNNSGSSSSSSSGDEDSIDDEKDKTLNIYGTRQKERADIVASFRVYKMRGNNRVDVNTEKTENIVSIRNDKPNDTIAKLGIGKISNLKHL